MLEPICIKVAEFQPQLSYRKFEWNCNFLTTWTNRFSLIRFFLVIRCKFWGLFITTILINIKMFGVFINKINLVTSTRICIHKIDFLPSTTLVLQYINSKTIFIQNCKYWFNTTLWSNLTIFHERRQTKNLVTYLFSDNSLKGSSSQVIYGSILGYVIIRKASKPNSYFQTLVLKAKHCWIFRLYKCHRTVDIASQS